MSKIQSDINALSSIILYSIIEKGCQYAYLYSIVKARNLCCKAREGKKQDKCGVSCSGDIGVPTPAFTVIAKPLMET